MPSGEQLLRATGLRVTRPRVAVLDVLTQGGHLEVEEITRQVRERLDSASTQAVYDVLGALSRAGPAPADRAGGQSRPVRRAGR